VKISSVKTHTLPKVVNVYCGAFLPVTLKQMIGSRLNVFKAGVKSSPSYTVCVRACVTFVSFHSVHVLRNFRPQRRGRSL